MITEKIVISNPTGLHLRPAGELCKEAIKYDCSISFVFKDTVSNAKSVLSVLGACVKSGDEIELTCDGSDEQEAMAGMIRVIENGLGE